MNNINLNTKILKVLSFALALAGLSGSIGPATAQVGQKSRLVVEVTGARNQQGQICLSLFANSEGFPVEGTNTTQNQCSSVTAMPQRIIFDGIEQGNYAVAVLHDANRDGEINRNSLGIPREGFGFSRNPTIFMGPPTFGEASIVVVGRETNIQIQLNYL